MTVEQLKLLAQRLRSELKRHDHSIGHGQSLDLIAALPGLRNWPEVLAFPIRVAQCEIDISAAQRLSTRVRTLHAIHLAPQALQTVLSENGT